jgi:hypothetical protein
LEPVVCVTMSLLARAQVVGCSPCIHERLRYSVLWQVSAFPVPPSPTCPRPHHVRRGTARSPTPCVRSPSFAQTAGVSLRGPSVCRGLAPRPTRVTANTCAWAPRCASTPRAPPRSSATTLDRAPRGKPASRGKFARGAGALGSGRSGRVGPSTTGTPPRHWRPSPRPQRHQRRGKVPYPLPTPLCRALLRWPLRSPWLPERAALSRRGLHRLGPTLSRCPCWRSSCARVAVGRLRRSASSTRSAWATVAVVS